MLASCGSGADADGVPQSSPQVAAEDGAAGTTTSSVVAADGDSAAVGPPAEVAAAVAGTFEEPIALVVRPGDDHLWLAERAGVVRRLAVDRSGELSAVGEPQIDIGDETTTEAERGLLGLAFSRDGATMFLSSTDLDGNSRLAAYDVIDGEVDEDSAQTVFTVEQPYGNHNGGHVVLGPDGNLWLGLGDGGSADDPDNRAQDPTTPLGKIVRLDPDEAEPEADIVVSGLRNPWRFAFDEDGSLWIGDVGQGEVEEVDYLPAAEIDGANLGWSGYEGREPYLEGDDRRPTDPVAPVFEYGHSDGNCSITGGFVYRGTLLAGLAGWYLFADYCAGQVRAISLDGDGNFAVEHDLGIAVEAPVSFAVDAEGEPFVLSQDGDVVRVVPA